jgi:hypothetical protein
VAGNEHLEQVSKLVSLRSLIIIGAKSITDSGLTLLSCLHDLRHLALCGGDGISGTGFSTLKACKQLEVCASYSNCSS